MVEYNTLPLMHISIISRKTNPMDQKDKKFPGYVTRRRAKLQANNEDTSICPECGAKTVTDLGKCEIYCPDCGLIVKASISYVGVKFIRYPYGTLLY